MKIVGIKNVDTPLFSTKTPLESTNSSNVSICIPQDENASNSSQNAIQED